MESAQSSARLTVSDDLNLVVEALGPTDGRPVFYFHSPSTGGEEVAGALSAASHMNLRLVTLNRPSVECAHPVDFLEAVAQATEAVVVALAPEKPTLLAWSGGAPYALASAARLGDRVGDIHLVSPVPGPLTGPHAVPNQTDRLREVAATNSASPWVGGRESTLRDYLAVASPWPFALDAVAQPVTIWSPSDDEIVPPHLASHLATSLNNSRIVAVDGAHDWLIHHWKTVLDIVGAPPEQSTTSR